MSASRIIRPFLRLLGLAAFALAGLMSAGIAAEPGFPFDKELMLDAKAMKGSKRIPILTVDARGTATIDLWCNSVEGRVVVAANTLTITAGARTERQCDPARMKRDDDLLAALLDATAWRRERDVIVLTGAKTLRFRPATN
jgi:heat shock protein HslJ